MEQRITQHGIAKALGLSLKTVQRAFADSDKVANSTKENIRAYAEEVGYTVNRTARALVRNRTKSIQIFTSASPEFFWNKVAYGIDLAHRHVCDFGYTAEYNPVPPRDTAAYMQIISAAAARGMDAAAVVNNPEFDMTRVFGFLNHSGIPYITLNIDAPESERLCFLGPDYGEGGQLAAEFLGKTIRNSGRILIIHNPVDSEHALAGSHVNEERLLQFVSYLSIHFPGLEHQVVSFSSNQTRNEVEQELESILLDPDSNFQAIYSIAEMHDILGNLVLRHSLEGRFTIIVHGIARRTEKYLRSHAFTAAVHQNPVLQGYYAVRILEYYLETGRVPRRIPAVSHSIVLGANIGEETNFGLFTRLLAPGNVRHPFPSEDYSYNAEKPD